MVIDMRYFKLFLFFLMGCPAASFAGTSTATISWQADPSWLLSAGGTYLNLPIDSVTAKRRIAIRFTNYDKIIGEVWDDPAHREVNITIDGGENPIAHIRAQAVAYQCGPWGDGVSVTVGDSVCLGDYPSTRYHAVVSSSGITGAVLPESPRIQYQEIARKARLKSDVIDNLDGTVSLITTDSSPVFFAGDTISITGSTHYDGIYTLPVQVDHNLDNSTVTITATYVAEDLTLFTTAQALELRQVIDSGFGTVGIPVKAHGFIAGQSVRISGSTHYDGVYTLGTQSSPDIITITKPYQTENVADDLYITEVITDGSAKWSTQVAEMAVLSSEPSRRIIGRENGTGQLWRSGTKFKKGNKP